jgi:hypothetical protein
MNSLKSLFNSGDIINDFVDRNPPDKELDLFMSLVQKMIQSDLSISSVFLGYNLLTDKIFDDPGWAFWNSANIGHTSTMGFDKKILKEVFSQGKPIYLCYVAIPIDEEDYLIEKDDMLDWSFEDYLRDKINTNINSIGAISKNEHERCRTFKFLYQKQNIGKEKTSNFKVDLSYFQFISTDHIRFENGVDNYGHQKGANRMIEIIKHESVKDAFTVTIYNLNGNHLLSSSNIQMQPKIMKIISDSDSKIEFRGFGNDPFGFPFSGYGLTLYLKNNEVERIILHMLDKNVDIEYFK